ncbi:hypothetical protein [Natrialba sp. PRR66]|nr:hypothetical protein [Natrialba sp. PRR66]
MHATVIVLTAVTRSKPSTALLGFEVEVHKPEHPDGEESESDHGR